MPTSNKRFVQKVIAVVLIVALLDLVGVAPSLILFLTAVVAVIWFIVRRSQNRELRGVFQFYLAADSILRDEDRRWFAFEVVDVIDQGEEALAVIPDPPPLHLYALGALYHKIGNHEASAEYLSRAEQKDFAEEYRVAPSPQLRRYVSMLRELEQDPSISPLLLGAVRNLERNRGRGAARMLMESRSSLESDRVSSQKVDSQKARNEKSEHRGSAGAPPPITEVLQDVYPEDGGTGIN
jgi:hypothetical protein